MVKSQHKCTINSNAKWMRSQRILWSVVTWTACSLSSASEGNHDAATGDKGHEPCGGFGHSCRGEGVADILKDAEFDGTEGANGWAA